MPMGFSPDLLQFSGIILGFFCLTMVYGLSMYAIKLLLERGPRKRHPPSYRDLVGKAFGKTGFLITDISIIVASFGAMCSYLVILGKSLAPIVIYLGGDSIGIDDETLRQVIIASSMALLIPLSCLKTFDALKYPSMLAIVGMLYIIIVVLLRSIQKIATDGVQVCADDAVNEDQCVKLVRWSVDFFKSLRILFNIHYWTSNPPAACFGRNIAFFFLFQFHQFKSALTTRRCAFVPFFSRDIVCLHLSDERLHRVQ
jgi:hypothetical protein